MFEKLKPSSQVTSWDNLGGAANSANEIHTPEVHTDSPQGNSLLAQALAMKSEEKIAPVMAARLYWKFVGMSHKWTKEVELLSLNS
ncbi:LADA_0D02806g1_1 [Lachancea dasiensis]|uniref:LADA_0D02806g1_1 n=1 Tax=Lachancea dasiensis TaxID=1072105 RepID=A0A1G4J4D3_9SACH|nr:LADA_0D02806g1_1 [Lachancea dasiensis]